MREHASQSALNFCKQSALVFVLGVLACAETKSPPQVLLPTPDATDHATLSDSSIATNSTTPETVAAIREPPRILTPCERLNEAKEWRFDQPVAASAKPSKSKKRSKTTTYHFTQGVHALLDGQWIDCPARDIYSINNKSDWDLAWKQNHPYHRRAPLARFRPTYAMDLALAPPLVQVPSAAKSVGWPHNGSVENGAHLPTERIRDYPYFLDRSPERVGFSSHAMEAFIVAMQAAMRTLGPRYEGLAFVILDASLVRGGKMALSRDETKSHGSHQSGRDVDVALALRVKRSGQIWWAGDANGQQKFNSKREIEAFLKHLGRPSLTKQTREIQIARAAKEKVRAAKGKKPTKVQVDAATLAFQNSEELLTVFIFDAIWQLVAKSWIPGHLRWAFLDEPQQKMLVAAAIRAQQKELAQAMISYDAKRKRFRKPTSVRCLHQPKETGHDRHIHLRFNCGPAEDSCRD